MVSRISEIIKDLQEKGLPIIILRDPMTKNPSITFSFFVISGTLVILGLIGKFAKVSGGIDMDNALNFFYGCGAMYIGRKITSKDPKRTTEIDK